MRQYGESIAVAILCTLERLDDFDRIERGERYPFHNVLPRVEDTRAFEDIGLVENQWTDFRSITTHFNKFSHPTRFAMTMLQNLESGQLYVGPQFDAGKTALYKKEIALRISAGENLCDTAVLLGRALLRPKNK